jgi:hypothetical protein
MKIITSFALPLLGLLATIGCGGQAPASEDPNGDTAVSEANLNATHAYVCNPGTSSFTTASLTLAAKKAKLKLDDTTYSATYDSTYKPSANKTYVRFEFGGASPGDSDESEADLLVAKNLVNGKSGGIKLELTNETFETYFMSCTKKE